MNDKYMKVLEVLAGKIINNQIDIDLLKYENQKLKDKLESVEKYCNYYGNECEKVNN